MSSNLNDQFARSWEEPLQLPEVKWSDPPDHCVSIWESDRGSVAVRYGKISSGPGQGIRVVEVDNGPMQITLLPTRGMSIWQVVCDDVPFKWNSPVRGPIHPSLVPILDSNGLGWLEGFDEFLVRCGLSSNGAPDFDSGGRLLYPLHGRIANLPARKIWCESNEDGIAICGLVHETRLFFNQLRLVSKLRISPDERQLEIEDVVTNLSSKTCSSQLLYHINVGRPVLGGDAKLIAPIREIAPRDDRASEEIGSWNVFQPPRAGYQEAVFFCRLASNVDGQTSVMLESNAANVGLGLRFDSRSLPCFVLWKNTADDRDGYVAGMEPATNFPNPHSMESSQGRVVALKPGEEAVYRLMLCPLTNPESVAEFKKQVEQLEKTVTPMIHRKPKPGWSTV